MNIIIDIGHPAHVHLFRNFYHEMKIRGHNITVTVKDLPSAIRLLDIYDIPYTVLGVKGDSLAAKIFRQGYFDIRLLEIAKKTRADIGIGSSVSIAHASSVCRMKSVIFDDDDDSVEPLMARFGHFFADMVVTPSSLAPAARKTRKAIFYPGYHELAYLYPSRFTPDPSVPEELGIKRGSPYFVMRFNAFRAYHDTGVKGFTLSQKLELAQYLEKYGRVFITTEEETEPELSAYRLNISPEKIHSLLGFSTMFIGDSQTMTSEAAVLGVPALRLNTFAGEISYLKEEEEKYGLTYAYKPEEFEELMKMLKELLTLPDLKEKWKKKRDVMLQDKIDVTSFMVWLIENYTLTGKTDDLQEFDFSVFR